jgi:hypothetical protein
MDQSTSLELYHKVLFAKFKRKRGCGLNTGCRRNLLDHMMLFGVLGCPVLQIIVQIMPCFQTKRSLISMRKESFQLSSGISRNLNIG